MTLGLNRGELLLVAFIFGCIYVAGLLPRIAKRIGGSEPNERERRDAEDAPAQPSSSRAAGENELERGREEK